jgi:hypothetical protein
MMKIPRYKVISEDGLGRGTKVIDLETGVAIPQISRIELRASAGEIWTARIDLVGVAVDVNVGDIVFHQQPYRRTWWERLRFLLRIPPRLLGVGYLGEKFVRWPTRRA